jgi:hypothetical protein
MELHLFVPIVSIYELSAALPEEDFLSSFTSLSRPARLSHPTGDGVGRSVSAVVEMWELNVAGEAALHYFISFGATAVAPITAH